MKKGYAITLAVVGVVAAIAVLALNSMPSAVNLHTAESKFAEYVSKYQKSYATKEEYEFRMKQFVQALQEISQIQGENADFILGVNEFSDWTMEEYKRLLGFRPPEDNEHLHFHKFDTSVPNGPVDWKAKGKVNAVKNQGSCGSCWAFSAVASAESKHAINSGQLLQLSEQQLVDCSKSHNYGCNGGMYDRAWGDVQKQGGFMKQQDYPYTGRQGSCRFSSSKAAVKVTGYRLVQRNSPDQLKAALAKGPVSVGISAGNRAFQSYKGGIFNGAGCGTQTDHAVVAVGWGSQGGQEFFLIRNSWGASWGEQGYIRMAVTGGAGVCGLYAYPAYVDTN